MSGITTLAELNAVIEQCGCCPAPRCCPPIIECQSVYMGSEMVGFKQVDSGSESVEAVIHPTLYLRMESRQDGQSYTVTSNVEGYGDYDSDVFTSEAYQKSVDYYDSGMNVNLGSCWVVENPKKHDCEFGGSDVWSQFAVATEDHTPAGEEFSEWSYVLFKSYERTKVYSSAEGEVTQAWTQWQEDATAWDIAHPDYEAEHSAWVTANSAYQQWFTDRDNWVNEDPEHRNPEDYPVPQPPDPGEEPQSRPEEPAKFYGPCVAKIIVTETWWERRRSGGDGPWETVLVDPSEISPPLDTNPWTHTEYLNWDSQFVGTVIDHPGPFVTTYSEPYTWAEFVSQVDAYGTANIQNVYDRLDGSDSSSVACVAGDYCAASRVAWHEFGAGGVSEVFFRFRIKLNKCCGYKTILSRWQEVFYPQVWLDWEALVLSGSSTAGDEPADVPVPATRAWSWTGTPPLCNDSSSASSSSSLILDPYDDPSMWSPWSSVIRVPSGKFGEVSNRNYQQKCYDSGTLWDDMPAVFGEYDTSSSSAVI